MLTMEKKARIRHAVLVEGKSQREVARETGHSRNTIRKMLEDGQIPQYKVKKQRKSPILGPYKKLLEEWVEEDRKKIKKKRRTTARMYQIIQKEYGYQGSDATVRAFVGKLRRKSKQKVYVPLAYDPGETGQVDFGEADVLIAGQLVTAHMFVMWLGYSSAPFVQAYPAESQEVFFTGHVAAFNYFGGVPREIWYDNLKIAVNKVLKGRNRLEQDAFISFRSHYLYEANFCNTQAGWEKGGVEGRVGYLRRNFLIPTPEFESWEALNEYLRQQCDQQQTRQLKGRSQSIGERLQAEQAQFLPLPNTSYPCCKTVSVKANTLSLVTFATNRYSVPVAYAGDKLLLRAYVDHIEICAGAEQIASHQRCWQREQDTLNPYHYLPLLSRKPRAFAHAKAIRQWQRYWPAVFDAYYDLLKQRLEIADATRLFIAILQLGEGGHETFLAQTLHSAITHHCFTLVGVGELLRRQMEPQRPASVPLPEYPTLAAINVPLPDLQQFDRLLSPRSTS